MVFDGKSWPDAVIPFTLTEVTQENLEGYAYLYSQTTGGFLAGVAASAAGVERNVYSIPGDSMTCFAGLSQPPGDVIMADMTEGEMPVLIAEDGTEYTGQLAQDYDYLQAAEGKAGFLFPDAPAGVYTLQVPYLYLSVSLQNSLCVNLSDGIALTDSAAFSGGSFSVAAIEELDEKIPCDYSETGEFTAWFDRAWKVYVRCDFDDPSMAIASVSVGICPNKSILSKLQIAVTSLLNGNFAYSTDFRSSIGLWDENSGCLVFEVCASVQEVKNYRLDRLEMNPASAETIPLMVRWDHPTELKIEAK